MGRTEDQSLVITLTTYGGAGESFGTHVVDLEVDPETEEPQYCVILSFKMQAELSIRHMLRVSSKVGSARNRLALNEEYIYGQDGRLQNAGFLDYRVPVASDLPMIDTVIVEVPSDSHPFGVRGVGKQE